MADLVVDKNLSCVIDVSQFEHDTHKTKFAADFGARLFFRKKSKPSAMHLFLEECEEFLPQDPERGEERMIHEFKRIWKLGRNFGIGGSLISQRPQEILKKALNLTECLFAFQTNGTHERKAIEAWISDKKLDQDIAADLPKLKRGQCHLWSPSWLCVTETILISEKWTFDASRTPKVGEAPKSAKMSEINFSEIAVAMAATVEKEKANNPDELKKKIHTLESEVKKWKLMPTPMAASKEVPALTDAERKRLTSLIESYDRMEAVCGRIETMAAEIKQSSGVNRAEILFFKTMLAGKLKTPPLRPVSARESLPVPVKRRMVSPLNGNQQDLGAAHRKFLTVLANRQDRPTRRNQLAVISGYSSKSSHVDNTISNLRVRGYIHGERDNLVITAEGLAALGSYDPLPSGEALIEHWVSEVGSAGGKMLRALVETYPNTMSRDELAEVTGFSVSSSHVDNTISGLRTRELVTGTRDALRASEEFFS